MKIKNKIIASLLSIAMLAGASVGLMGSKKVEHVHATDYTKIASYDFSGTGSGTSKYDASGLKTRFTQSAQSGTGLSDIVSSISETTNTYASYTGYASFGLKFGTSSANGTFTVSLTSSVVRVVVVAAGWGTGDNLKVGSAAAQTPGVVYTGSNPLKTLTYDITESSSVQFTFAKRGFIQSIDFYEESQSSCTHNWVAGTVHAPTCTEAGYTEYECSECGETKQDDVTAALGHDYGAWTEVTPASCLTAGEERRVCSHDSSHVEVREIAALGHSYVDGICERCGAEEPNEVVASTQISTYAEAHSWANQVQYLTMNLNSVVTATVTGSSNSGKYYSGDSSWRLYSSESAKLTFTTANDETLISATLTFLSSDSPVVQYGGANVTSGSAVVLSGSSAEFSVTSGKAHFTALSVTYAGEPETIYTITYLANAEDAEGTMSPTSSAMPIIANCAFTRDGYSFSKWNTQADGEGDDYAVGAEVSEDLTLYAIWEEYIAPIGANVTMSGVSEASSATVNGHAAIKCGTGKAGGSMSLTINASNISKIKFYLAGWKGEGGKTVSVTVSEGTVSPNSITTTADDGITSGTPFTLSGVETSYKVEMTLTNVPADAVITLSTSGGNMRYVVWGATDLFAESFANEFNSNLTCDATGEDGPSFTSGHDWTTFHSFYNGLDAEEQGKLHDATFTVTGTGSSTVVEATGETSQSVAEAIAKYDYIVGKYDYTNFINRTVSKSSGVHLLSPIISDLTDSSTMVVIIFSIVSISSIALFVICRKKYQN